ncbi:MAG TPA: heme-binding protein [Pyrinomonadaceae bacterium]|nr:heme-binding protein [Pyrinomonadaceae bacterium]
MREPAKLNRRLIIFFVACTVAGCGALLDFKPVGAQASGPILVSQVDSTRAIVFDSVTRQREPFNAIAQLPFSSDGATRLMLFAMNLYLQSGETVTAVTADAEDANHNTYTLPVEYVGPVPEQTWATSIIVRLPETLGDTGDVLVRIRYRGVNSNRVRVGIGHVGGGLPDDLNAVPTPGSAVALAAPTPVPATNLTPDDIRKILAQAGSESLALNKRVTIAVVDRIGSPIGFLPMSMNPPDTTIRSVGTNGAGLEAAVVPSTDAAFSKAVTAAFLSTSGNAFSTRTASFIIQEHFPPGIAFRPSGPLYGVQFSSLPCSDINRASSLGLAGDPGGLPIYKNGKIEGAVGIEGDGLYTVDRDPSDDDQSFEELIAASAVRDFEPSALIRADNILADGIRLPYSNVAVTPSPPTLALGSIPGLAFVINPNPIEFTPAVIGGVAGEVNPRFPFISGTAPIGPGALTAVDVNTIISHAAQQANITRGAIRQPIGSNARVTIAVVDTAGVVLGLFRQQDAPMFGFDVAVQKARTAAFFSGPGAGASLRAAGLGAYADRALADGIKLDGTIAFSARAVGFLHRPFFPDGIEDTNAGPFSTSIPGWSPFNAGLQLDIVKDAIVALLDPLSGPRPCTAIPGIQNGIQIFPGSVPLYKNGVLVGAIGISGDGVDQDDLIGAAGASGFAPDPSIRSDQIFVRGVRLPFLKFPRSPNL